MEKFDYKTRQYLVLGKQGKTGRRVAQLLSERGASVIALSRSTTPVFDWQDETSNWKKLFTGFDAIYVTYQPDLAIPQAIEDITRFTIAARQAGVQHVVLLSGRGEPAAQQAETIIAGSGLHCHVIRASWFNQNFSEGFIAGMINQGVIYLPRGDMPEPFIDADDIAQSVVACLTEPNIPEGVYEVTGPELLSFKDCISMIARQMGKPLEFVDVSVEAFIHGLANQGFDSNMQWLMKMLFNEVLDGRNSHTTDTLSSLIRRPPTSFEHYVARTFGC